MRKIEFIAVHRGGTLDMERHQLLATWAADCAEQVLPLFEKDSSDASPRLAIKVLRAWAKGEVQTGVAQKAAYAANAAARGVKNRAATAAARSAGQAVATAHFADHSLIAADYARQAIAAASESSQVRLVWQLPIIPEPIRKLVITSLKCRFHHSATE